MVDLRPAVAGALLGLLALASCADDWKIYKYNFGKSYDSLKEERLRKKVFFKKIKVGRQAPGATGTQGVEKRTAQHDEIRTQCQRTDNIVSAAHTTIKYQRIAAAHGTADTG